ncbi:MAG: hypothetical protein KDC79_00350 [Cyclobacteriaceae bacterium]|nr:hypothetical protein [Cyclobacteriaceae bacterium]
MPRLLATAFFLLLGGATLAQEMIESVTISTDSADYISKPLPPEFRGSNLYFVLESPDQEVQLTVVTKPEANITKFSLVPTPGYELKDSVLKVGNNKYVAILKFTSIFTVSFPKLVFRLETPETTHTEERKLYPYIFPKLEELNPQIEVFNGQEVRLPLPIDDAYFLKYDEYKKTEGILEYKIVKGDKKPLLVIKPNATGNQMLTIGLASNRPFLNKDGVVETKLFDFGIDVRVVRSKFNYLNFSEQTYFFEPRGEKPITVWFDYNPLIQLNKTYRIEDQETPGGRLIGELYTRAYVENQNRVIATLRTYSLHQKEEGFLYLKEGDRNRFFTNFNIVPKPYIEKVSILRPGKEWTENKAVYPNEEIELKIQGTGLDRSEITFMDGKYKAIPDTVRKNNEVRYFTLKIPADIKERSIPISLNQNTTSFELLVNEYQRPRKLDFVTVNYGDGEHAMTSETFFKPALYQNEIGDVVISFHNDKIDGEELYGTQFLNIEIRLWDKQNRQIETREIEDVKIVPDKNSIRNSGYNHDNESALIIRLNDVLVNKTYDLRPWSKIEIIIEHDKTKYNGSGFKEKAEIYRSENVAADIEVSFPAGLLAKNIGEPGIGSLTGLSVASMANFTFYKKNQIKKVQPLRLGVGFMALNAINSITGSNAESDIGIVALASFQPLHSESKVNFPIYAGFGYLFKSESLFLLIGPGIKFTF